MKTVKTATIALLLVLIPYGVPFAESVEPRAEQGEQRSSAEEATPAGDQQAETAPAPAAAEEDSSRGDEARIDTDGYSWSGRSLR